MESSNSKEKSNRRNFGETIWRLVRGLTVLTLVSFMVSYLWRSVDKYRVQKKIEIM